MSEKKVICNSQVNILRSFSYFLTTFFKYHFSNYELISKIKLIFWMFYLIAPASLRNPGHDINARLFLRQFY